MIPLDTVVTHGIHQRTRSGDALQRIQYRPCAGRSGARATVRARLSMRWSGPRGGFNPQGLEIDWSGISYQERQVGRNRFWRLGSACSWCFWSGRPI